MIAPRFSANIGFLWPELDFIDRIHAAKKAGFQAVECHFPYEVPESDVKQALNDTGLPLIGLNTQLGINGADDFGVAARPDRVDEARGYIDQAVAYAIATDCKAINVVPGKTGRAENCEETFRDNLSYACKHAAAAGINIHIEPINTRAAPGFHLTTIAQAIDTIQGVQADNLKLMFDCFHVQIMEGDLANHLHNALPHIGHIQISAVHDRGEPDTGEINYAWLFNYLATIGWKGFIGAEYKPRTSTDEGLVWMTQFSHTDNTMTEPGRA